MTDGTLVVSGVGMTYRPPGGLLRLLVNTATTEPVRALDGVSFQVEPGEVVGLVGPNGAGKSTLLRVITTLTVPTEGEVTLGGMRLHPGNPRLRNRFGLSLPEDRSFYWRLTGRQNLEYFAALAGLERSVARVRIDQVMAERGLTAVDKAVFGYSSGMLAQLGIARATLHRPSLLVLDEPTRSLDPVAGAEFCAEIRRLAEQETAVLMASHRLDEVAMACDRVLALVGGRLQWTGTAAEIARDPAGLGQRLRDLVSASEEIG